MSFTFFISPLSLSKFSCLLFTITTLSHNEQPLWRGPQEQWQLSPKDLGGFAEVTMAKFYSRVLGFANWKHYRVFWRKKLRVLTVESTVLRRISPAFFASSSVWDGDLPDDQWSGWCHHVVWACKHSLWSSSREHSFLKSSEWSVGFTYVFRHGCTE